MAAAFDDPNLVADAGLVPVMRLAARGRLPELVRETVRIEGADNSGVANPAAKVTSLIAAMCAGADSVEDADQRRHGAMPQLFDGIRAPSTLGTFLRSFATPSGSSPKPWPPQWRPAAPVSACYARTASSTTPTWQLLRFIRQPHA